MTKYVIKRIGYMIIVFFVVSFLMYSVYNLIPSDPARAELEPLKQTLKPAEYEERYQQLREEYGLDDPIPVRYARWMGLAKDTRTDTFHGMLQGYFGFSQVYKKDVAEIIPDRMENTIFINIFSTILALGITIPLGIYCAVHKKGKIDNITQVITIIGYSIPVYIIALIFIWIFAVWLGIFPVTGSQTPGADYTGMRAFLDRLYYISLPVIVMTFGSLGGMTRYVRASIIAART